MINNINNDLIKELRRRTGISIIKCKQALIKSAGNIDLAIENMRRSGLKVDLTKSNRLTPAGVIAIKIDSNQQKGLIVEINCETDFVARNKLFQEFADAVITTASNESINDIDVLQVRFKKQLLMLIDRIGESIKIRRFAFLSSRFLHCYIHGLKIGVIVGASRIKNIEVLKHIAMHIAAENPKYIDIDDISPDILLRERCIQMDLAMNISGIKQTPEILEKVIKGRMDKFISKIVLKKQKFIMDMNKTIENVLNESCIKIDNFIRFEIGDYDGCN